MVGLYKKTTIIISLITIVALAYIVLTVPKFSLCISTCTYEELTQTAKKTIKNTKIFMVLVPMRN